MTKEVIYEISQNIKNDSLISEEEFSELYQHSITNPDEFWNEQASSYLEWISDRLTDSFGPISSWVALISLGNAIDDWKDKVFISISIFKVEDRGSFLKFDG